MSVPRSSSKEKSDLHDVYNLRLLDFEPASPSAPSNKFSSLNCSLVKYNAPPVTRLLTPSWFEDLKSLKVDNNPTVLSL